MLNIRIFVVAVLILCLTGITACKKEEAKVESAPAAEVKADEAKADEAKADEAKADEAKADEAKADEAKADDTKALDVDGVAAFFEGIGKVAEEANGDCDKLGTGLKALLDKDRDALTAGMKNLAKLDENSEEAKKLNDVMEKVMADDSALSKGTEACKENENVVAFNAGISTEKPRRMDNRQRLWLHNFHHT